MAQRAWRKLILHLNPLVRRRGTGLRRSAINDRIAVSPRWRFVYFRVPKAANSTVVRTLAAHDCEQSHNDASWSALEAKRHAYPSPAQLGLAGSRTARRSYFAFSVVRDPYARLLSAYLDKIANQKNPRSARRSAWIRGAEETQSADPVTFGEFVDYLAAGGLFQNIHWAPQASVVPSWVHYFGRCETLEEDLRVLIPRIFGGVEFRGSRDWAPHRTDARELVADYYTPRLRARVSELYADDFRRFGYSPVVP